ncbi:MAG: MFS transporter [Lactobacillus sp.]|nr:MFS transporter [Lactobacillus sp.]MDN6052069.1 MFS transporter [Lactobacillus sp.]
MTKRDLSYLMFALFLGNVMTGLDSTVINTAIPAIVAALHGIEFMGWIVAVFLLGMSVSIPLWTKIGERIGNKKAYEISVVLFILGSLFQGLAGNIYFFLLSRFLMGLGAGGMGSLPYIIVGYVIANIKQRTKMLGVLTAGFNGAAILGPLVGGTIIDSLSWHWVFFINIPIGLIAIVIAAIFYHPQLEPSAAEFDWLGASYLVLGLLCFLLGIQLMGIASSWLVSGLIAASFVAMICFIWTERQAVNPVLPLTILKNQALNGDFLIFATTWGAFLAVNTYLPTWAQALLGLSALMGGMALIPNSIVNIIASQSVSSLQEKISTFALVSWGIGSMAISALGMFFLTVHSPLWQLVFLCSFSGIGVGFIFVGLQVKVQIDAGQKAMAAATSTSYLIRILAQTLMAAIYGVIMNFALENGVRGQNQISLNMMNKLSDAATAKTLPQSLLPAMRAIFHNGIQHIMLVSCLLLVLAASFNYYYNVHLNRKAKTSQAPVQSL